MDDVFHELRSVGLQPLPFFCAADALVSDALAAELICTELGLGLNGYRTDNLSSKKISRLVSRLDPVPDVIKQASMLQVVIDGTIDYFRKEVMKDLNLRLTLAWFSLQLK